MKRPPWEDYGYSGGMGFAPPSTAPTVQQRASAISPKSPTSPDLTPVQFQNPTVPAPPKFSQSMPLGSRSGGPQGNLQFPMKGAQPGFSTQNIPRNGQQGV